MREWKNPGNLHTRSLSRGFQVRFLTEGVGGRGLLLGFSVPQCSLSGFPMHLKEVNSFSRGSSTSGVLPFSSAPVSRPAT